MKDLITKDTAISLGVVAILCAGTFWAATVQSDISYVKKSIVRIEDRLERISAIKVTER